MKNIKSYARFQDPGIKIPGMFKSSLSLKFINIIRCGGGGKSQSEQGRSEGFWRPGRRLPFGAPPPTPLFKKFVINQNLRNRLNCSQNLAI